MDTTEDNAEREGQFRQSTSIRQKPSENKELLILEKCPFCSKQFLLSELNQHFVSEHKGQHSYLRVNDSIVRNKFSVLRIEKIEIILLGYSNANIEISGANFRENKFITGTSELLTSIPANYEGRIKVKVNFHQGNTLEYVIYNKSIPEFRNEELDSLILEWQKELELSSKNLNYYPNFKLWKSQFENLSDITYLDQLYFDGFLEYGIGSNLERKEEYSKAKEHLENAFGLLLPFRTTLSKTVIRLLGLKMNCFGVFKNCALNSPFALADEILNKSQIPDGNKFGIAKTSEVGIFIDSFSHLFLDTLEAFYNTDEKQFSMLLSALKRNPFSSERNNTNKLHYIAAQHFRYIGEIEKAVDEFRCLEYEYPFGNEAKNFLKDYSK